MPDSVVDSVIPKLERRIAQIVAQELPPGLAVGLVRDQELIWQQGFGAADIASGRAVNEHTLFLVASISKTFTATAIMQLRDERKLRLDDPVVRYIPEFSAVRNPFGPIEEVTLLRLLTHRSGLPGESPTGHWSTTRFPSREEILSAIPKLQIAIEPDSAFKYSNLGFALLGEVIARISGRSFSDYVRTELLEPLGMESSTFELTAAARERMATGYLPHPYEDVAEPAEVPASFGGYEAAAGLRSSVADLAKWISLQFRTKVSQREAAQVLRGESLSTMHHVRWVESDWKVGYALTWWATRVGENIYHHHSGGDHGFLTFAAFNKLHRFGVIALSNATGHAATGMLTFEALEMLVGAARDNAKPRPSKSIATPADLKRYLGVYVPVHFGGELRIEFRSGALVLRVAPTPSMPVPLPLVPLLATQRPNVFTVTKGRSAGEQLAFEVSDPGTVTGFSLGELKYLRR
jgi:D-alanyl-D-alanine carboxypeptidase